MKTTRSYLLMLFTLIVLIFVPNSFAQDASPEYVVQVIYFHPKDRQPQSDIDTVLDGLVKQVQSFYADEMERHGFGGKTFRLETDISSQLIAHRVTGKFNNRHYYDSPDRIGEIEREIFEQFDTSKNIIYLIWIDLDDPNDIFSQVGGRAGGHPFGGTASILALDFDTAPRLLYIRAWTTIAHELGHAFGLGHDFRDDRYIMSYGDFALQDRLSYCAAEWLDAHRYFNNTQTSVSTLPAIRMLEPALVTPPNTIRLRFEVTHSARLNQAQLLTNSFSWPGNPGFDPTTLLDCKSLLSGNSDIIEFVTTELAPASEYIVLGVIDEHGNFAALRFPIDMTSVLPDSEPVLIPDANLAGAIRESLGLVPGTTITQLDMLGLGRLSAPKKLIADLTGLQYATNLQRVDLNENQIVDLTPLAELTQLRSLLIIKNQISDVSSLSGLTQLSEFWIWDNQISDINPLTGLTNLTNLHIGGNQISDISPLTGLTNLRALGLQFNQISDISRLAGLTKLGYLNLQSNQITDVSPLTGFRNLEQLYLAGNSIEDLSPLRILLANNPNVKIDIDIPFGFSTNFIADQTFIAGADVSLTLPIAVSGTAPYTYSLSEVPAGLQFDRTTRVLSGTPTTVGTINATYTATDATGASAALKFTIEVIKGGVSDDPLDVNADGQVTVIDLAIVALFYGTQVPADTRLPADVNADGIVNILDLTAVAQGIDAANDSIHWLSLEDIEAALLAAAEQTADIETTPEAPNALSGGIAYRNVAAALADARLDKRIPETVLKELLHQLTEMKTIPPVSALFPNYPNPFNPETWIPYHLATDAAVVLTIYDVRGSLVRTLMLGHQPAGVYESRARAAYWDGKNQLGEPVASGLYFYTLTAGDFTATRKLLIAK